jgi:hypothetical protein
MTELAAFNVRDWFWIVGGDTSQAWSTAAQGYVTEWPSDRVSRITNEVELYDAIVRNGYPAGAPSREFTAQEVYDALVNIEHSLAGTALDVGSLQAAAAIIQFSCPPISI